MGARGVRRLLWGVGGLLVALLLVAAAYIGWVALATKLGVSADRGTRAGLPVDGPVTIARDARGIPHIRAGSDHDLFFAEGYAMAADRLFQMDATRRYVLGRLAEVLGPPLLDTDRQMRSYGIAALAEQAYKNDSPAEHAALQAFADGINAAAAREPVPPEYRAFFFGFEPWRPQDAIAVGYATVLDLDDRARWILSRDWIHRNLGQAGTDAFLPLSDPKYDRPADGEPAGTLPPLPALPPPAGDGGGVALGQAQGDTGAQERGPVGSNAWAVGADRTTTGRAMLANDPHLELGIPGVWWLVEARSPHYHIAGATLAGTPGVTIGHNDRLAWGVTAGETAAMRLLREPARGSDEFFESGGWLHAQHRRERIGVRFGSAVDEDVLSTPKGTLIARDGDSAAYLRDWTAAHHPQSGLEVFLGLNRAAGIEDGVRALRDLAEPALNVLLADDTGRVAYHLAGGIPLDDAQGRWAVDGDVAAPPLLPFDRAPQIAPSRDALIVTSNQRANGAGAPRLAPFWPPPYRAYEVHRALALAARPDGKFAPDAIAREQADNASPAETEFAQLVLAAVARRHAENEASVARLVAALREFDGTLVPESRGATAVVALRRDLLRRLVSLHMPPAIASAFIRDNVNFVVLLRALRERPRGWVPRDDYDGFVLDGVRRTQSALGEHVPAFGAWAAQPLRHPLAAFGFSAWNGPALPGHAGSFAPAVQWNGHGQSFRAVWTPGDWDNGTIDVDAGESGEPGSPHYRDRTAAWNAYEHTKLPFSDAAVQAAATNVLTLTR